MLMKIGADIDLFSYGYLRVAAAVPRVSPADTEGNALAICEIIDQAAKQQVSVLTLPELAVTGYTCADLFHQKLLIERAVDALDIVARHTIGVPGMLVAVGLPLLRDGLLYNCAAILCTGKILGVIPKTYVPNYGEFYEKRWFASGACTSGDIRIGHRHVPFGTDILFEYKGVKIGVEICEDLWAPIPVSSRLALGGAEIILNLSASNELIGKHDYLLSIIRRQSAALNAAYVYSSSGYGESSTDLVFAGNGIIAENGALLGETERFVHESRMIIGDIDLDRLRHDRVHNTSWHDAALTTPGYRILEAEETSATISDELHHPIDTAPFVPHDESGRFMRCGEIIAIQSAALARRLEATGCRNLIVGISGGLDSTLALLVAHSVFRQMHVPLSGLTGITMPGFGTTGRTYNNATELVRRLGATLHEINIGKAVRQHFEDIDHDESIHDVTYENSQARERTQILMDYANKSGGMVLGTGDLSELALGWCTYNGDHMSMYGINASVPKTLVKHLVEYFARTTDDVALRDVLLDIIDTPISPELIPAAEGDKIRQKTEDLVGPYRLHDFVLYNMLRHGYNPSKIYMLACAAFKGEFDPDVIRHWLKVFYRRFFNQQFKRSCMPDGPKVGSICLSPRGDWRMPSDASARLWLEECDKL